MSPPDLSGSNARARGIDRRQADCAVLSTAGCGHTRTHTWCIYAKTIAALGPHFRLHRDRPIAVQADGGRTGPGLPNTPIHDLIGIGSGVTEAVTTGKPQRPVR